MCPLCNGTGRLPAGSKCPVCSGSGEFTVYETPCRCCGGAGRHSTKADDSCGICNGTGTIKVGDK